MATDNKLTEKDQIALLTKNLESTKSELQASQKVIKEQSDNLDKTKQTARLKAASEAILNNFMQSNHFYISAAPEASIALGDAENNSISFLPRSKVVKNAQGNLEEERWGLFFTTSKSLAATLDKICNKVQHLNRATPEDLYAIRQSIEISI